SPLVRHETVCAGYTLLYTALCNSLGLDAIGVTSDGHAWNMIRLEGAWLWVDCTWGDNGGSSKDYRFFALSDSDLASVDQSDAHVVEAMWSGLLESATYSSGASATLGSLPTETVETPSISVVANGTTYVITFSTGTSGSYIYYTLDGSTPSVGQSKAQRVSSGSSVTISATKTFTPVAIAAKADMKDSASVTGNELQSIAGATETASTVSYVEYDNRVSITSCTVQPTATSFVYNGQQQAPAVYLYYQGALVPSHYYSVTYPSSVNVGTYVATISGNGSVLQGTTSFAYTITKASLGAPSVSLSNATSGITISWKKVSGATGYIIQRKNGSGYSNLKTVGSNVTKYTDGSVKSKNGATYNYRVRAVGNTNYGESVSASKKIYRLTTPSFSSAKNIKTKSIELKWKKNKKATGYQIKYVVGSKTKTVKITKNKTLKKVIKKLKKNKTYKVYIRSYKKNSSGTYYFAWSSVKKVKIKK
nr:hypothetical protein [Lachnospiraceae bacterium]